MKRVTISLIILIILIIVLPMGVAHAAPSMDRTIKKGETIEEDLVVVAGKLLIEEGATVNGDVNIFGGSAELHGAIDGDVAIFGGKSTLSGSINGDLVIIGGDLDTTSSADVDGECILVGGAVTDVGDSKLHCTTVGELTDITIPSFARPEMRRVGGSTSPFGVATGLSLVLGILALLVGAVMPDHVNQVSDTLARKPAASGTVGLLTAIAGPSLIMLLAIISFILTFVCIGLLGWPIVFILPLALAAGSLLGWVAIGASFGRRLAGWFKLTNRSVPLMAALGTVVLTVVVVLLGSLPFWLGSWVWRLATMLVFCAGLGAVTLTRFGTRPYPRMTTGGDNKVSAVLETLPISDDDALSAASSDQLVE